MVSTSSIRVGEGVPMRMFIVAVTGMVMMGTLAPIGAAEMGPNGSRLTAVFEQVRIAPFVQYGKKLPPLVKAAVKAMPKDQQSALDDVYVVTNLAAFVHLFNLSVLEESEMLTFLRSKDAFAFIGRSQLFVNGTNPTIREFEAAFASGDMKPVRLLRARLLHESRHAGGESKEVPCYELEVGELDQDYSKGLLTGAESYIEQVRSYYKHLLSIQQSAIVASR